MLFFFLKVAAEPAQTTPDQGGCTGLKVPHHGVRVPWKGRIASESVG